MNKHHFRKGSFFLLVLQIAAMLSLPGCSTRHLSENQYLLRKNTVILKTDGKMANRTEIKQNLGKMIIQKPNTNAIDIGLLPFRIPLKLWRYNNRFHKLHNKPDTFLPKAVERPVISDTAYILRSAQNMKNYLFNQGYFYAKVTDTYIVKRKKAYVTYNIQTGHNYQINSIRYNTEDTNIARIIQLTADGTALEKGKDFAFTLTADEMGRLVSVMRNNGYYKFNQDNITFVVDTMDQALFHDLEHPYRAAVNYVALKNNNKPLLDVDVNIHIGEDSSAFNRYTIGSIHVYPDFATQKDLRDSSLYSKKIEDIQYSFHHRYIHPWVLHKHIYMAPGDPFSQEDVDKTQAKLNELGIFQFIRIVPHESRATKATLDYDILLAKAKKYDFSALYELSSGSTYALGHSVGINLRNKNFLKGANLLTIGINGGIEYSYNGAQGKEFFDHFSRLTNYYGVNASIDFPKFLAPVAASLFDNSNLPHTIIGGGQNVLDRLDYFTLLNTSANFSYSWHETISKTWTLSPAFINIIRLPSKSAKFDTVLMFNEYLKNSYKENFIEGENILYTFDNSIKKHGINYFYLKLGLEEAGAVLGLVNNLVGAVNNLYGITYAEYAKFDFDARRYIAIRKSVLAFRFTGGIGIPYGSSPTLPYIKQYFSGGPYSLRGWRIRTLGPGRYIDTSIATAGNQIDRTGDIKLELNGEFRFPITMLFGNAIKMNGALFGDAGNIWLARKDPNYPDGEFEFAHLDHDIAADLGIGTRFDIASFLTLRVDLAMPVKKPYIAANSGWVFDSINFGNPTWRANNLVFNVSIGYPF